MNEHMLGIAGKRRQTAFNRFLARRSPLNPDHRLRRSLQQRSDGGLIQRLTDHADPADVRCRKGGVQSPGQHRPAQQGQQELVAIRPIRRPLPAAAINRCTSDSCSRQAETASIQSARTTCAAASCAFSL